MSPDQFWLTDALFSIELHLPTDSRGKARVDDRHVISGIVHVLKSGGRWVDRHHTNGHDGGCPLLNYLGPTLPE